MGTRFREHKWIAFALSALMLTGTVPVPAVAQARDAVGAVLAQQATTPAAQEATSQDKVADDVAAATTTEATDTSVAQDQATAAQTTADTPQTHTLAWSLAAADADAAATPLAQGTWDLATGETKLAEGVTLVSAPDPSGDFVILGLKVDDAKLPASAAGWRLALEYDEAAAYVSTSGTTVALGAASTSVEGVTFDANKISLAWTDAAAKDVQELHMELFAGDKVQLGRDRDAEAAKKAEQAAAEQQTPVTEPAPTAEPVADPAPTTEPVADPAPVAEPVQQAQPVEQATPAAEPVIEPVQQDQPVGNESEAPVQCIDMSQYTKEPTITSNIDRNGVMGDTSNNKLTLSEGLALTTKELAPVAPADVDEDVVPVSPVQTELTWAIYDFGEADKDGAVPFACGRFTPRAGEQQLADGVKLVVEETSSGVFNYAFAVDDAAYPNHEGGYDMRIGYDGRALTIDPVSLSFAIGQSTTKIVDIRGNRTSLAFAWRDRAAQDTQRVAFTLLMDPYTTLKDEGELTPLDPDKNVITKLSDATSTLTAQGEDAAVPLETSLLVGFTPNLTPQTNDAIDLFKQNNAFGVSEDVDQLVAYILEPTPSPIVKPWATLNYLYLTYNVGNGHINWAPIPHSAVNAAMDQEARAERKKHAWAFRKATSDINSSDGSQVIISAYTDENNFAKPHRFLSDAYGISKTGSYSNATYREHYSLFASDASPYTLNVYNKYIIANLQSPNTYKLLNAGAVGNTVGNDMNDPVALDLNGPIAPKGSRRNGVYDKATTSLSTIPSYYIKYDANGGTLGYYPEPLFYTPLLDDNKVYAGTGWKDGYEFNGWNTKADGTGTHFANNADMPKYNCTLYAEWKPLSYTVSFNANKPADATADIVGTTASMTAKPSEAKALTSNGFSLVGWTFEGWSTEPQGEVVYADGESVSGLADPGETVTLYAKWRQNGYTAVYDGNKPAKATSNLTGSTAGTSLHYDNASETLAANGFAIEGWTFTGWNTSADGTGTTIQPNVAGKHNLTATDNGTAKVYAQWRPNRYTVVFDRNDANYPTSHAPTGTMVNLVVDYDTTVNLPAVGYAKQGWHFDKWTTDAGGTGRPFADGAAINNLMPQDNGVYRVYAQYAPNEYTFTYVANAPAVSKGKVTGMPAAPIVWKYDTNNSIPNAPSLKGYKFDTWYLDRGGQTSLASKLTTSQNTYLDELDSSGVNAVTVYGAWTPLTYRLEFSKNVPQAQADGVSGMPDTQILTYDAKGNKVPSAKPKRDGYDFIGWSTSQSGGSKLFSPGQTLVQGENLVDDPQETPPSSVTFYAQWEATTTSLTFDANGGSTSWRGRTATFGAEMPTFEDDEIPTRRGYSFTGFYDQASGGNQYYNEKGKSVLSWDKTGGTGRLYAQWVQKKAMVTISSELEENSAARDFYGESLIDYTGTAHEVEVAVGGVPSEFATVPTTVTEKIAEEGQPARDIEHQLVGWQWSYTGSDGQLHEGTLPVIPGSGANDSSYTNIVLYGLPDDEVATNTINIQADYRQFPFTGIMAVNGSVSMTDGSTYPDDPSKAGKTIEVIETSADKPTTNATARFKTNGENWTIDPQGVEVIDQNGARGRVDLSSGNKTVTMSVDGHQPYDLQLAVSYEEKDTNNGTIVFKNSPKSDVEGHTDQPMSFILSAYYNPVRTTYHSVVKYEQLDGSYSSSEPVESAEVDAGSEIPLGIANPERGYHFSRARYSDDLNAETSSSLSVRYNGTTNVTYYYDLDDYTATLASSEPATLAANGEGWTPANDGGKSWSREFTVLDEITLPTLAANDYHQDFVGWRLSDDGDSGYLATLSDTAKNVRFVADWRLLTDVPEVKIDFGKPNIYDGEMHDAPFTLPEGYTMKDGKIYDEDGRQVAHFDGDTSDDTAGDHTAKVIYENGFVGEGGKKEQDVVWRIDPVDVTGKDGKPAATVTIPDSDYTGNQQKPKPTVTYEGKTLEEGKDYTVTYSNNTMPGTATATLTFKGNYKGTISKTFTIKNTTKQMFRLYNPNSGEHFYTANAHERDVVKAAGWSYEGIGWIAPSTGDPVYRLYNSYGGEHHYTMNKGERDSLKRAGWTDEGIGWYSDQGKHVKVLREYNPNQYANNHNYTPDANEHKTLLGLGWRDEGVAWYAVRAK